MDSLRKLIARIQSQIVILNRSQQLVIGLCAVVIAGSLLWLTQWSSRADLVPLLANTMSMEEINTAREVLDGMGVKYQVISGGILVPEEKMYDLLAKLTAADALPSKMEFTFASLLQDSSPFRAESENIARRNWAIGTELANIIAASSDVESANVIVNPVAKRSIGSARTTASASVSVQMQAGKPLTDERVRGIARLVAGAVPGLEPHMVAVVDSTTGKPFTIPSPEDEVGFGLLEERRKVENHLLAKVHEQLSYIPGILVAISADLDADQTVQQTLSWETPQMREESSTTSDTASESAGGEPGTSANVGVALGAGGVGGRSTSENSQTAFYDSKPRDHIVVKKARFVPKRATAAINVPRSFVARIFKLNSGADTDPKDADLEEIKRVERLKIQGLVQNVLMNDNPDDVQVDFYYDLTPDGQSFAAVGDVVALATQAESADALSLVKTYGPEAGLAGLALLGMGMMLHMVKKSSQIAASRRPAAPEEEYEVPPEDADQVIAVGGGPIGLAGVSDGFLTGHEIDEETLRQQELRKQVSKLVGDDPQNAADMIRRWVEQPDPA